VTERESHARVAEYLERTGRHGSRVVSLTGDASDRRYFRVVTPTDGPIVLAVYPSSFEPTALPFINVCGLLEAMPVPVPAILDYASDLGIVAEQDLGDVTLQAHLGASTWADHAAFYRDAVAHIVTLQQRGAELTSPNYLPYSIAFDVEKLGWELDFFLNHFVVAYRGASITPAERDAIGDEFATIAEALASEPRVLCHRDYHSRNLMLHDGRLYMIDFQDARMGPDTYDLASLLRDSYVDIYESTVNELIAYFLALKGAPGDESAFRRRFDLMALQRNLKALGTFGYQTTTRRNPVYLQYIPRTLRYVRDNLQRIPERSRLRELLARHVDEIR
jgi:aminoglycoside/choline kinase family phosphotransferase